MTPKRLLTLMSPLNVEDLDRGLSHPNSSYMSNVLRLRCQLQELKMRFKEQSKWLEFLSFHPRIALYMCNQ
jgi:hypothetical protein